MSTDTRNDGGAAFHVIPPQDEHGIGSASGYPYPERSMSLRDWFAGQAIGDACTFAFGHMEKARSLGLLPEEWAAIIATRVADELIAALAARSSKEA